MIGSIKGKIILTEEKFLIVEASGVGYKIYVSPESVSGKKTYDEIFLWIHTHIREDSFDLYGFTDYGELEFFELLLGVSSIGPRSALTILGVASIEILSQAVNTSDISYLTKISGIGRKTAEKIIIELRDKVGKQKDGVSLKGDLDALEALKALGYSQHEAREALREVTKDESTNTKIREALKILGKK